MPQYFTPREASQALETIRPLMEEILRIRADLLARRPDLWPAIQKSVGNGGSAELSQIFVDFDRLDKLVHRVLAQGVHIKDLNIGLMDFPCLHGGREVFLCWKFGEPRVEFWHEIESGFAGRQPIDWE